MSGEFRVPAPPQVVWDALNDPRVLQACIPGCQAVTKHSETELDATILAKVGPVKASFEAKLSLSDLRPPAHYVLSGQSKAAAGFAHGTAEVDLAEDAGDTVLRYRAEVKVGGKLAQVGSRLIDGTARKLSEAFFANLAAELGAGETGSRAAGPAATGSGSSDR
jgi:hypothetical protein